MNDFFQKITGGRFITLVIDSVIYPLCVMLCGMLTIIGKMDTQTFIAVLGGYALLVKETRKDYFERNDRRPEPPAVTQQPTKTEVPSG